jgi:hypothetical protein
LSFLQKEELLAQFSSSGRLSSDSTLVPYRENYLSAARMMLVVIAGIAIGLVTSGGFRWTCAIFVIICVAMRAFHGLDSVELALHGNMFLSEIRRRNSKTLKVD